MSYTSNREQVDKRLDRAVTEGLRASAKVLLDGIIRGYDPPQYFRGPAVRKKPLTQRLIRSLKIFVEDSSTLDDKRSGVSSDQPHARYWEMGWFAARLRKKALRGNRLLKKPKPMKGAVRRFFRKEIWRPAAEQTATQQLEAFRSAAARELEG